MYRRGPKWRMLVGDAFLNGPFSFFSRGEDSASRLPVMSLQELRSREQPSEVKGRQANQEPSAPLLPWPTRGAGVVARLS